MTNIVPAQDLAPSLTGLTLSEVPVPTGREEEWRFTPIKKLRGLLDANEMFSARLVSNWPLIEIADGFGEFPAMDRLALAAVELANTKYQLNVPADTAVAEPILIKISGSDKISTAALQIVVGAGSKVTVILEQGETHAGTLALELVAGESSKVSLVTLQDAGADGVLSGQHHLRLSAGSEVIYRSATVGGGLVRINTSVAYEGRGASAKLTGAFFTAAGQHHEHRQYVGHELPDCTSDVVYKGALQGDGARSVWVGDVLIRSTATGTSTYELNRNLLLTDGARADSVPNLEIETGDIAGAGHASATGRFDEEQLFYLMSRGITEIDAKRLVVRGFLGEVVEGISAPEVIDRFWLRVDSLLEMEAQS